MSVSKISVILGASSLPIVDSYVKYTNLLSVLITASLQGKSNEPNYVGGSASN